MLVMDGAPPINKSLLNNYDPLWGTRKPNEYYICCRLIEFFPVSSLISLLISAGWNMGPFAESVIEQCPNCMGSPFVVNLLVRGCFMTQTWFIVCKGHRQYIPWIIQSSSNTRTLFERRGTIGLMGGRLHQEHSKIRME